MAMLWVSSLVSVGWMVVGVGWKREGEMREEERGYGREKEAG
jgi:hypothetical protein